MKIKEQAKEENRITEKNVLPQPVIFLLNVAKELQIYQRKSSAETSRMPPTSNELPIEIETEARTMICTKQATWLKYQTLHKSKF